MSNQNILKRLKQKFGMRVDYDIDHTSTKRKTSSLGKNVRLKGYLKNRTGQDSLSDTESSTSTSRTTGYHIRICGNVKSTNSSPASSHRVKGLTNTSQNQATTSIITTATTKLIQPPAYTCCVNRVKIIDNCCGRTEHNIIYHQHHPIVGASNAGDLASVVTQQTVLDMADSTLVCQSATTPRSFHCKRGCNCSRQKQLHTLPALSKRLWNPGSEGKCIDCEKEQSKKEKLEKTHDNGMVSKLKQQSSASAEELTCTCGLNDIQDNIKNRALEKASSVDNSLCSAGIEEKGQYPKIDGQLSTDENEVTVKQSFLQRDEVAAMLLDEPSYICATLPCRSNVNSCVKDCSSDVDNSGSLAVDKPTLTESGKDSSFSDDDRWLGNSSSGYCTQSDEYTDTASSITSSYESQRSTTTCSSVHNISEHTSNICESYVSGGAKENMFYKVPQDNNMEGLINQCPLKAPSTLFLKLEGHSEYLSIEKETSPPPIPQRNYRTNSFYKQQQLDLISIPTKMDNINIHNTNEEVLVDIHEPVDGSATKISPLMLTCHSEWPAPPPPLDSVLNDEVDVSSEETEVTKDTGSADEPIHMTMEEVWLDAKSHGIPLQKPVQCDRTYSSPDQASDPSPDIIRSASIPNSVTTPPLHHIDESKLFVDLNTKCASSHETQVCRVSGDLPYNHPSSSLCDVSTTSRCRGLCMIDGPVTDNQNYYTMPADLSTSSTDAVSVSANGHDVPPMLPPKRHGRTIMPYGRSDACGGMFSVGVSQENTDTSTQTVNDFLILNDNNHGLGGKEI